MSIRIYLSNLEKYVTGNENGRWLQLPMEMKKLKELYKEIVGDGQEHIILDYNAFFEVSEHEDVFKLNAFSNCLAESGIDEKILKVLFEANSDWDYVLKKITEEDFRVVNVTEVSRTWNVFLKPEERYGMVLHEEGYNTLFSKPIPKEMVDYINFAQIYECLAVNDGWIPVEVNGITYLVSL